MISRAYREHRPYLVDLAFRMLGDLGATWPPPPDDTVRSSDMTARSPPDHAAAPVPVAPAAIVRVLVRPLTKLLNPLMVRIAGRRFSPMAQIHHVGRRSGKAYVTPVTAHLRGDVLLIGLTFGNLSDWSRNVRAAAGCTVRLGGRTYRATSPELVDWADDRALIASAFNPMLRAGLRLLGIRQFMRLHAEPTD